ncbi:hypothetical protein SEVIR_5G003901v4 [Setaria viridis]
MDMLVLSNTSATTRILVIGGTGIIEQHLVAASLNAAHPTAVLVRPATVAADAAKASLVIDCICSSPPSATPSRRRCSANSRLWPPYWKPATSSGSCHLNTGATWRWRSTCWSRRGAFWAPKSESARLSQLQGFLAPSSAATGVKASCSRGPETLKQTVLHTRRPPSLAMDKYK